MLFIDYLIKNRNSSTKLDKVMISNQNKLRLTFQLHKNNFKKT